MVSPSADITAGVPSLPAMQPNHAGRYIITIARDHQDEAEAV